MFPLEGGPFANAEKVTSSQSGQARAFACLALARLRIATKLVPEQDDVTLGHAIASSAVSDEDIQKEITTLRAVTKAASANTAPPVSRSVVPQVAGGDRGVPSLVSIASGVSVAPSMAVSEDELGDF